MKNISSFELSVMGVRIVKEKTEEYDLVSDRMESPEKIVDLVHEVFELGHQPQEHMVLICLDTKNQVNGLYHVSTGTLNMSIVHPRDIFQRAILSNAKSIIIAHNHPSGDPTPSKEDTEITQRLRDSGELLGIRLLDHIIIGGTDSYYSYKTEKNML